METERIRLILEDYLSPVPSGLDEGVCKYLELLDLWGRRMPLTSVRDHEQVIRFHFGESIFAISLMGDKLDGRLADVGSGAGFPGLAIELARPSLFTALIESNRKKCAFLHEVIRSLSIARAEVIPSPFETAEIAKASLSFVSCRAVGRHEAVLGWAKEKLQPGGSVLLWLGRGDATKICDRSDWRWDDPALIPGTSDRFVLKGARVK